MAFSEVNVTEFCSTFPVLDVGFKHRARAFPLSPDHTSHRVLRAKTVKSYSPACFESASFTLSHLCSFHSDHVHLTETQNDV